MCEIFENCQYFIVRFYLFLFYFIYLFEFSVYRTKACIFTESYSGTCVFLEILLKFSVINVSQKEEWQHCQEFLP